jgi:hypothetical protein
VAGAPTDMEDTHIVCQSLECGIHFERSKTSHELKNMQSLTAAAIKLLDSVHTT